MPTNDIKAIASSVGANVVTQAAFAANSTLLNNGFPAGVVDSATFNKAWRQSSFVAAAVAQFVADRTGQDVLDDGDLAKLERLLVTAVNNEFATAGVSGAFTLAPSPAITAYSAGQRYHVKFSADGNGADTINVNGLGAKNLKQYSPTGAKVAPIIKNNLLSAIEYDGVDWVILDPLPGGLRHASTVVISAATVLDASYAGKVVCFSGTTPYTVTLPSRATVDDGNGISFWSSNPSAVTIARAGTDNIYPNIAGVTSVVMGNGDTLTLENSTNVGGWVCVSGTAVTTIGIGQIWQDVAASRAFNTNYTNTTNKPIEVYASGVNTVGASSSALTLSISGVLADSVTVVATGGASSQEISVRGIVPPGATYAVNQTNATKNHWTELR